MPSWFRIPLSKNPEAAAAWRALIPSRQKEILRYFSWLKSPEARARNVAARSMCCRGSQAVSWRDRGDPAAEEKVMNRNSARNRRLAQPTQEVNHCADLASHSSVVVLLTGSSRPSTRTSSCWSPRRGWYRTIAAIPRRRRRAAAMRKTKARQQIVGKAVGGQKLRVRVQETVYHPGHYRVALAVNSRDELPPIQ